MAVARVLLLVLAPSLALAGVKDAPAPMWGEVLDTPLRRLSVSLAGDAGEVYSAVTPRLRREGRRVFFAADWPGRDVRRALAAGTGLNFEVATGGAQPASRLALDPAKPLPEMIHILAGQPAFPDVSFVLAKAEFGFDGDFVFTAVLSNAGKTALPGRIRWSPGRAGEPGELSGALTLAPGVSTPSTIRWKNSPYRRRHKGPSRHAPGGQWTVLWEPDAPGIPRAFSRVRVVRPGLLLVDGIRAPALTPGKQANGELKLAEKGLSAHGGQYLEIHLEASGVTQDDARRALSGRTVKDLLEGGPGTAELSMAEARVTPLGEGRVWVSAQWLLSGSRELPQLGFRTASPSPLPGNWMVRYVSCHDLFTTQSSY